MLHTVQIPHFSYNGRILAFGNLTEQFAMVAIPRADHFLDHSALNEV